MESVTLTLGIDLGQRVDSTAIALLELIDRAAEGTAPRIHYETRHLERLPLGTKYPDVARRVAAIQSNAIQVVRQRALDRGNRDADVWLTTWVDATGAVAALDIFREQGITVTPCFFNHGDRRTENGDQVVIGKAFLVNRLQALLQTDRLHLPPGHPEAAAMMRELQDYEIKIDQNANDRYGAFKTGTHDDLVTALGLAAQVTPPDTRWMQEVDDYMTNELAGLW